MTEQFRKVSRNLFAFICLLFVLLFVQIAMLAEKRELTQKPFEQSNRIERVEKAISEGVVSCSAGVIKLNKHLIDAKAGWQSRRLLEDVAAAERAGAFSCGGGVTLTRRALKELSEKDYQALREAIKNGGIFLDKQGRIQFKLAAPQLGIAQEALKKGVLIREVAFDKSVFQESNPRLRRLRNLLQRGRLLDRGENVLAETTDKGSNIVRRDYPLGEAGFHVLGYIGHPFDRAASDGLEAVLAPAMAGPPQNLWDVIFSTTSLFKFAPMFVKGEMQLPPPPRCPDVVLSLDRLLTEQIWKLMEPYQAGAAVCLELATGDILALVSKPGLDPDAPAEKWRSAFDDKDEIQRLPRRAWRETYFPGSSFKMLTTAAAFEEGAIPDHDQGHTLQLEGAYHPCSYGKPIESHQYKQGGAIRLDEAFAISDNEYFARLTVQELACQGLFQACGRLGFFEPLSLLPDELAPLDTNGIFSTSPNRLTPARERMCPVKGFDDCMLARSGIGQQDVQATPLWMAYFASAIARGGGAMPPNLIKRIIRYDEKSGLPRPSAYTRKPGPPLMSGETAAALTQLMSRVTIVNTKDASGTARIFTGTAEKAFRKFGYQIAGKTGTAETGRKTVHAWFVAFGPLPEPKYAVAVVLEDLPADQGNLGGERAAPIARAIFESLLPPAAPLPAPAVKKTPAEPAPDKTVTKEKTERPPEKAAPRKPAAKSKAKTSRKTAKGGAK